MEVKKLALVVVLFACGPHEDFTPLIHVDPNAAQRMNLVHRPDKGPPANAARVHVMKAGEELGGPNATGRPGDYVIENDEVAFVIEALGHSAGFGVSTGLACEKS